MQSDDAPKLAVDGRKDLIERSPEASIGVPIVTASVLLASIDSSFVPMECAQIHAQECRFTSSTKVFLWFFLCGFGQEDQLMF